MKDIIERRIPSLSGMREIKRGYRKYPINTYNPRHSEPLVDLLQLGFAGLNYYGSFKPPVEGAVDGLWVRLSVAKALTRVDEKLKQMGYRLYIQDAYRPTVVQWFVVDRYRKSRKEQFPSKTDAEIEKLVEMFAAIPSDNPLEPTPHLTGAAIDLKLQTIDGQEVELGKKFQRKSKNGAVSEEDRFLFLNSAFPDLIEEDDTFCMPNISEKDFKILLDEARKHRRILYWTMVEVGHFVCNPTEWWHFSLFDQMWAYFTDGWNAALYGEAKI